MLYMKLSFTSEFGKYFGFSLSKKQKKKKTKKKLSSNLITVSLIVLVDETIAIFSMQLF